jgi:hypothetical protein
MKCSTIYAFLHSLVYLLPPTSADLQTEPVSWCLNTFREVSITESCLNFLLNVKLTHFQHFYCRLSWSINYSDCYHWVRQSTHISSLNLKTTGLYNKTADRRDLISVAICQWKSWGLNTTSQVHELVCFPSCQVDWPGTSWVVSACESLLLAVLGLAAQDIPCPSGALA